MKPPILIGAVVVLCLAAMPPALAQVKSESAPQASPRPRIKPKRTVRPQPEATRAPGPAGNLNAPSTNFNGLSPETGDEPSRRGDGAPPIRGSVNSNGQPEMGLGF